MRNLFHLLAVASFTSLVLTSCSQPVQKRIAPLTSGNPLFPGWYADPEAVVFGDEYWIYPTYSAPFEQQLFMDAFSSKDLVHWTKHPKVLQQADIPYLRLALWAPAVLEKDGRYYIFFGTNDIHSEEEVGGIGVAVADKPEGPFKDALGKPLINQIVNGAQPIDQYVFKDDDGTYYMYYGGWGHCNMVKMSDDLLSIRPFDDGEMFKEITPTDYKEGPFMFKRNGKYYFMWSEGGWTTSDYRVAYAISDSPFGPFERIGTILQEDPNVGKGAGHHSVIKGPGVDEYYIVYHRRPLEETAGNSRQTCIEHMYFDKDGKILPVRLTFEGVGESPLAALPAPKAYTNPVINYSLPDPTIVKAEDGFFYLFATEDIKNVPIHRSRDLVNWSYVGTAFDKAHRPSFVEKGSVWAPDISYIDGQYVLYYAMSTWGGEWECGIGRAVALSPQGPYQDLGMLFRSNEIGVQNSIDPYYIEDGGKKYLFWGSFHGLYAVELTSDGLNVKEGSAPVKVAGDGYEGVYVHKKDGWFYLMASRGSCCEGLKSTYHVTVGRSRDILGEYVNRKGEKMLDSKHEVILEKNGAFVGPGHNSEIVTDDEGQDWIFYHGVSTDNPSGRVLLMDKVSWKDGWPVISDGTPSKESSAPVFSSKH